MASVWSESIETAAVEGKNWSFLMVQCGFCRGEWNEGDFVRHLQSGGHRKEVENLQRMWLTFDIAQRAEIQQRGVFFCPLCNVNCPNLFSYQQHIRGLQHQSVVAPWNGPSPLPTVSTAVEEKLNCGLCSFVFPIVAQLKTHLQGERHEKQLRIYLNKWPQMTKEDKQRHVATGIFSCSLCGLDNVNSLYDYVSHCNGLQHKFELNGSFQEDVSSSTFRQPMVKSAEVRHSPDSGRSSTHSATAAVVDSAMINGSAVAIPSHLVFCHLCLAFCQRPCDFSAHSYSTKSWKKGESSSNDSSIEPIVMPPESISLKELSCNCGVQMKMFLTPSDPIRRESKPLKVTSEFQRTTTKAAGSYATAAQILSPAQKAIVGATASRSASSIFAPRPLTPANLTQSQPESAPLREYCDICDIYTTGPTVMESHLRGKKHREKMMERSQQAVAKCVVVTNKLVEKKMDLSGKSQLELYDRRRKLIDSVDPLKKSVKKMESSEADFNGQIRQLAESVEQNRRQLANTNLAKADRKEIQTHTDLLVEEHRQLCEERSALRADKDEMVRLLHDYTDEIQAINATLKAQLKGQFACKPCQLEFTTHLELSSHTKGKKHQEKVAQTSS